MLCWSHFVRLGVSPCLAGPCCGSYVIGWDGAGAAQVPLAVCYLRHAFALGEHYNSVVPAESDSSGEEENFQKVADL